MDNNTVIRISDPVEMLSYIPYQLGFMPHESVVLQALRPDKRLGVVARLDLRAAGDEQHGREAVAELVAQLRRDGASDAIVALYTEHPRGSLAECQDVSATLHHLRQECHWADAPGPWVVSETTFGAWGMSRQCAPADGITSELQATNVAATMVLYGRSVLPSRNDLTRLPTVAQHAQQQARRAAVLARGGRNSARNKPARLRSWRSGEISRWQRLYAEAVNGDLPAAELGRMLVGLEDGAVRDDIIAAIVSSATAGGYAAPGASTPAGASGRQQRDWAMEQVFTTGGRRPDDASARRAEHVLLEVAGHCLAQHRAPALVLLAWLAWWQGDGARSDLFLQATLACEPDNRLASLLRTAVVAGVPPGWARRD